MAKNLKLNYHGYFSPLSGFGIANIHWTKHLARLGVDVSINAKFTPKEGSMEWDMLDEEERSLFQKPYKKQNLGLIETNPFDFQMIDNEYKVANTMCESNKVSASWPEKLNAMQQIVVPNSFCEKTFKDSGVTSPITIIPHGVDTDFYEFFERPKRDVFTFLLVGWLDADSDRKGALDAIQAFASEFAPHEKVQLILKTSNPAFGYFSNFTDKRIKTITKAMTREQLRELYYMADCFVFPSKAEGVGYPPREAMATGLPTILTNWSGLEDIASPFISFPLQAVRMEKRPLFIEQDGEWARISVQELMYLMRFVYMERETAMQIGFQASEYMKENFAWPVVAQQLKDFLESL